jgi:hypothetical protein
VLAAASTGANKRAFGIRQRPDLYNICLPSVSKCDSAAFLLTNQAWAARIRRMNSRTTGLRVASVVFALFALGHVLRLINHARVIIGTHHAPMWVSVVALIIAAGLSIWMWRLASGRGA